MLTLDGGGDSRKRLHIKAPGLAVIRYQENTVVPFFSHCSITFLPSGEK